MEGDCGIVVKGREGGGVWYCSERQGKRGSVILK
jgi:hypothetical protein